MKAAPVPPAIRIRAAVVAEAAALEDLQRASSLVWEEYREQLLAHPDAIEVDRDAIEAGLLRVAVDAIGRPLGFSAVLPVADAVCELDGLFVAPDAMRKGIGLLLVADLAARARAEGARAVEVTANPRALAFYERAGFVGSGEVATRFGPGVRMRLEV